MLRLDDVEISDTLIIASLRENNESEWDWESRMSRANSITRLPVGTPIMVVGISLPFLLVTCRIRSDYQGNAIADTISIDSRQFVLQRVDPGYYLNYESGRATKREADINQSWRECCQKKDAQVMEGMNRIRELSEKLQAAEKIIAELKKQAELSKLAKRSKPCKPQS